LPKAKAAKAAEPKAPEPQVDDQVRCEQCAVASPKEYRFCIGCGAVLPRKRDIAPAALANAMMRSGRRASIRPPVAEAVARKLPKIEVARLPADLVAASHTPEPAESEAPLQAEPVVPLPVVDVGASEPKASDELGAAAEGRQAAAADEEVAPLLQDAREIASEGLTEGPGAQEASPFDGEPSAPEEPEDEALASPRIEEEEAVAEEPVEAHEPVPTRRQVQPPPEPVTGRLIVIVEDGSEGASIELRGRQVDIGRDEGDIVLEGDPFLSPRHARLFRHEGAWYLRDLDSVNGVFRRLRESEPLRHGDRLLLGLEVLRYEALEHAEDGLGQAMQHGVMVFGSPTTQRRGRLCQRTTEGVTRDVYHLVGDETTLGREIGDIVFTSDPFMSRRHALVRWDDELETFVLSDLSSSNGTYLAIREDVRLDDGDFVRLGQHLFRVDLAESSGDSR
jgi:pSer/pThr/pTyr-binding forkhead associated (FHA) protein